MDKLQKTAMTILLNVCIFLVFVCTQSPWCLAQSCGRTRCFSGDGQEPQPFETDQRCSCSTRCQLFNDCCSDFKVISKSHIKTSLPLHFPKFSKDFVTCGLPRYLVSSLRSIHFDNKVPPFQHVGTCPTLTEEEHDLEFQTQLSDYVFRSLWPVIDTSTGIVFDSIELIKCHNERHPLKVVKGPLKYWPSFEIECPNDNATQFVTEHFDPFNSEHADKLLKQFQCKIVLTDPKNPVMVPISYCVPFQSRSEIIENGCADEQLKENCLFGITEIVSVTSEIRNRPPLYFRNEACAKCNGFKSDDKLLCMVNVSSGIDLEPKSQSRLLFSSKIKMNSFRMLMDFSFDIDDISSDFGGTPYQPACKNPGEVYVPFLESCQFIKKINSDGTENSDGAEGNSSNSKGGDSCFLELNSNSSVSYSYTHGGTLMVKETAFPLGQYETHENGSITLRYCIGAMNPSDDLGTHLHGENEIPIRDIISRFVTLGFMVLSVLSLAILLVVYGLFPQLRNTPGKVIMCLAATLMAALAAYAIGVLALDKIWYPLCFIMGVFTHFNFLASFAFSTCLAFDIWRAFKSQTGTSTVSEADKLFKKYSIFAWTFSGSIVLVSVILEFIPEMGILSLPRPRYSMPVAIIHPADFHTSQYHEHSVWVCWMMNRVAVLAYFKIPIAFLLFLNVVFFAMTIVLIRKASEHSARAGRGRSMGLRRRLFIYLKLSTIMGMTWLFGFIASATKIEALWIPFGLANALQGFYVSISFVYTKKVARLMRGWAANEHRRESIDPRAYASQRSRQSTQTTSLVH